MRITQRLVVLGTSTALAVGAFAFSAAPAAHAQCNPNYDYPGCTVAQQRPLESPSQVGTRANYGKHRWNQQNAQSMNDYTNDQFRRAYYRALRKLDDKAAGKVATDVADYDDPEYTQDEAAKAGHVSWQTWKSRMDCIANNGPAAAWCGISGLVSSGQNVIVKVQSKCNEQVMIGGISAAVGGTIFADFMATTIASSAVTGAGGAVVSAEAGCMSVYLFQEVWDNLFN